MDFGHVLKNLRISSGVGLRELSRIVDVSPTYLSLIENGKQPPPSDARVAQIEEALGLPPGYLLATTRPVTSEIAHFIGRVPEVADFLKAAKAQSMSAEDFMMLTGLINSFGWQRMRNVLEASMAEVVEKDLVAQQPTTLNPYVWPYLSEELIFDIIGVEGKREFFEAVVSRMANQLNGLQGEILVRQLLERERVASTGIGDGVAVPHTYLPGLDRMVVVLSRVPTGIEFDAIDERPVHLVLLLAGPVLAKNLHLKLLARATRLLSYGNFREGVLRANTPAEIVSIFRSAERRIP